MKQACIITLALLVLLSCNNRDNPVSSRDNKYDSGGTNFQIDGLPSITGSVDTLWYDFDHDSGTGSLMLSFKADDPNEGHDTLSYRFFVGFTSPLREVFAENESTCILNNLLPDTTYRCSLQVTDSWDSTRGTLLMIPTPVLRPPLPPVPTLTSNATSITLKWDAVAGATGYIVYVSDDNAGPFIADSPSIAQPLSGTGAPVVKRFDFNEPAIRFYIVASVNQGGESRSADTLIGTIYSNTVAVPSIDSVSAGTYANYIKISWHTSDTAVVRFGIYRCDTDTGTFKPIATVDAVKGPNVYRDSVTTTATFYYKIAAINSKGYSSKLSESKSGFLERLSNTTTLTVENYSNYIGLIWDPVTEAASYAIYRSSTSCSANMVRLTTTPFLSYHDSVTSVSTFYYSVAVIDSAGHEGLKSNCASGNISLLPAPKGIQVSNSLHPNTITLTWDSLPGAASYIIYRASNGCPKVGDKYDSTESTVFNDSVGATAYFYAIAAVDKAGRAGAMSMCYKGSIQLLSSPTGLTASDGTYSDVITLKWNALAGAVKYNIYRSAKSCWEGMVKITATTTPTYTDSVPTTDSYYYTVAGIDNGGIEGSQSACDDGRVKLLPAPLNLKASKNEFANGIRITWSAVAGATGYVLYRNSSSSISSSFARDTTDTTVYFDSITTTATQYYWVAALNRLGPGTRSGYDYGTILTPPTLTVARYTSAVNLSWRSTAALTMAYIYRSPDTSKFVCIDSTTGSSYNDNPPDFGGYYYRISAKLLSGGLVNSNTVLGYKLLSAPTGLKATDQINGVTLTWNRVPGTTYSLYKSEYSSGSTLYNDSLTDTVFFDAMTTTTRYYYRVAASNGIQTSSMSTYVIGGIIQTPAIPTSVSAYGTPNAIIIQWYVSSSSSTPTGFNVYRSTSSSGVFSLIDSTDTQVYADSVTDSVWYYYRVTAYNEKGTSQFSSIVSARLQAPGPPNYIEVSQGTTSKHVRITWDTVASATGYGVYRSTSSWGTFEKIGTSADSVFLDTSAVPSMRYYYKLTTIANSLEGYQSGYYQGMRLGPPSYIYANPLINGISVTWGSIGVSVEIYYIYRSTSLTGTFTKIDSTYYTSYIDSNEATGTNYYKVSCRNEDESALSTASEGARRAFPDPPYYITATQGTDSTTITVSWQASTGAKGYRIYRSMSDSFTTGVMIHRSTTTTSFIDTVPSDSFYYYRIKAYNNSGESSLSWEIARGYRLPGVVPLPPVVNDTTTDYYGEGGVFLRWLIPSQTIAYTGFNIYRSEFVDSAYTLVDATGEQYYPDNPPNSFPAVYYYRIKTYNQKGESEFSNTVSGSRQ